MITLGKKLFEPLMSQSSSKIIIRQWKIIQFLLNQGYVTTTEIEELSAFYIKDIVLNINSFLEYKNSL